MKHLMNTVLGHTRVYGVRSTCMALSISNDKSTEQKEYRHILLRVLSIDWQHIHSSAILYKWSDITFDNCNMPHFHNKYFLSNANYIWIIDKNNIVINWHFEERQLNWLTICFTINWRNFFSQNKCADNLLMHRLVCTKHLNVLYRIDLLSYKWTLSAVYVYLYLAWTR